MCHPSVLPFALGKEFSDQIGFKGPDRDSSYKYGGTETDGYLGQDKRTVFTGVSVSIYAVPVVLLNLLFR